MSGRAAIEKMFRDTLIVYADGTPRTQHLITNIAIEVDEQENAAVARSYVAVLQAVPDLSLPPARDWARSWRPVAVRPCTGRN